MGRLSGDRGADAFVVGDVVQMDRTTSTLPLNFLTFHFSTCPYSVLGRVSGGTIGDGPDRASRMHRADADWQVREVKK